MRLSATTVRLAAAAREAPATSRTEGEIKASEASGDRTRPLVRLVPVVAGLKGPLGFDAEVLRLLVGELGQLDAERVEVQ